MELLVKKAKRGDAEAFIELIEKNKLSMYRVARGFLQGGRGCSGRHVGNRPDLLRKSRLTAAGRLFQNMDDSYFD